MNDDSKVKIEAAIFDLDGTLLDTEAIFHKASARPLEECGESLTWDRQALFLGTPDQVWMKDVIAEKNLQEKLTVDDYLKKFYETVDNSYKDIKLLKGALNILENFKKIGIPIGLATTTPRNKLDLKTKYHPELMKMLDVTVTGDEVKNGKPSPEIFLLAAERLGKDPKKCVVFEDSPAGVQGAIDAGCYVVAIPDSRMKHITLPFFKIASEVIDDLDRFDFGKFTFEKN